MSEPSTIQRRVEGDDVTTAAKAKAAATPAAPSPRARLTDVRLTYTQGATWSLDGISLEVADGERLCVLGPNGSGKSTLAQVLAGLEAPDAGTVELAGALAFDGHAPDAAAYRAARQRTGLVFQNPEDQIVTSVVADDVAFGPENLGVPRAEIARRVDEELARVAMSAYAQADPARLSGGQQQRVALASALAMHPDLLVLDEPGAMLDVRGRRGIMRALGQLHKAGTAIVHITHFMEEALEADRVIVMARGRIVAQGTPREVFAQAQTLRELGLDVPLATHASLELGLGPCATGEELRREVERARRAAGGPLVAGARGAAIPAAASPADGAPQAAAPAKAGVGAPSRPYQTTRGQHGTPALSLRGVSFRYGVAPTLDGLTLDVFPGELVALTGQTGSGKSTAARLACALALPQAGTVEACGIATTDRRRRRELRGRVGYVMQHPERQLFAPTVFDDIAYGPRNLGLGEAEVALRVNEQLAFLGLSDKRGASPFELSGGQQHLVALAGVLAMEPQVIVLDEPVAGLDPRGAERLRAIIRTLHAQGRAILMVSHAMEDVAELADRMVVIDAGRVALEGTPREVFAQEGRLRELGLGVPAARGLAHEVLGSGAGDVDAPLTPDELVATLRRHIDANAKEVPAC